ncbi:MAG: 30S ribosomal protein S5 [Candidatus Taylorbacteria bacterium]
MDTTTQKNTNSVAPAVPVHATDERRPRMGNRDQKKNPRRGFERAPRVKPEFDQQIVSIRRVTRVASGGRRFSFSVALVAGDRKGRVGVGTGKAGDTSIAIDKALKNAKKNMIQIPLTTSRSIAHEVDAKFTSSRVEIRPAPGKGLIAGSSVRNVLELGGVTDVTAKIFSRSKNKLNNAEVAIRALGKLRENIKKV